MARVLLFTPSYSPRKGGLETVTRRLASELKAAGHVVAVATNRYPTNLPALEQIDGIEVHRQLYPLILPSPERRTPLQTLKAVALLPLAPLAFLHLLWLTWRLRPHVINIHYFSNPAIYMLLVGRLCRVPIVLSFHGSDLPTVPYPSSYRLPARWACRMAGAMTVCSEDMLGSLHEFMEFEIPIVVAHNGVAPAPSAPSTVSESRPFILLISRLTEKKGVEVAIQSMAHLIGVYDDVDLVIAGDGPLRPKLEKLAQNLRIAERVRFLGTVEAGEVQSLLRSARFLVVPSYWEAFGVVCLEAMAAGKAVIASATGGIPEIVIDGDTGLLVPPRDPEALAGAISSLLAQPAHADILGAHGRERASTCFTWERTLQSYLQAYVYAIAGSRQATVHYSSGA